MQAVSAIDENWSVLRLSENKDDNHYLCPQYSILKKLLHLLRYIFITGVPYLCVMRSGQLVVHTEAIDGYKAKG